MARSVETISMVTFDDSITGLHHEIRTTDNQAGAYVITVAPRDAANKPVAGKTEKFNLDLSPDLVTALVAAFQGKPQDLADMLRPLSSKPAAKAPKDTASAHQVITVEIDGTPVKFTAKDARDGLVQLGIRKGAAGPLTVDHQQKYAAMQKLKGELITPAAAAIEAEGN